MELKKDKVMELLDKYYKGNYTRFAREINLDASHLYRYLTAGIGGGKKVIGAVLKFCLDKKLNIEDYIDFTA